MITVAQSGARKDISEKLDPSAMANALERDRQQFRQKPEQKTLVSLQNDCMALQEISLKVVSLRDAASAVDCDPKQANEAASRVFALNTGIENFAAACAGGDKLADKKTTDDLLAFGRKCLQDSGLPSKDTAEIAGKLSAIDLSRDDKAHRFVVTLNAFQDGNRPCLSGACHRHRDRQPRVHVGPVRGQCGALAIVGRAELQGTVGESIWRGLFAERTWR